LLDLHAENTRRLCFRGIAAVIAVGAAARLTSYLARFSYWNDEAAVVVNVMRRSWRDLLRPLDFAQAAPPLFLWIERGAYRLFGQGEYSLRAFPLLLALLALPLFAHLAWRLLPPVSAFWATALFALSYRAIDLCDDVKQYSGDVFVALALLSAALSPPTTAPPRRMVILCAVAAVGLWLSFPAVFMFGALSLVLLPGCFRSGRRGIAVWIAGNAAVACSFLGLYLAMLHEHANPSLITFWTASFPNPSRPFRWLGHQLYGICDYAIDSLGPLMALMLVLGIFAAWRLRRQPLAAALPLVLLIALIPAAAHRYPFPGRHRLSLYLLPLLLLLAGASADARTLGLPDWTRPWWFALPATLVLLGVIQLVKHGLAPEESSTIRPVVRFVRERRLADERIYLFGDHLAPAPPSGRDAEFLCYWPDPPGTVHLGFVPPAELRARRFWIVYSLKRPESAQPHFADRLRETLGPGAHAIQSFQERGQAGAVLFERDL
jgi:hypothetical protein